MADINQYLSEADTRPLAPPLDTAAPSEAVQAPEIDTGRASTKEQREQLAIAIQQEKLAKLQEEKQERESIRAMKAAQIEAARQRAEESEIQQRGREVIQGARDQVTRTQETVSRGASEVGAAIGSVPIPGSLLLPLTILLLFFFALIPINGHTRLMWLWLVLSGNAHLSGENLVHGGAETGVPFPSSGGKETGVPFPSGSKTQQGGGADFGTGVKTQQGGGADFGPTTITTPPIIRSFAGVGDIP